MLVVPFQRLAHRPVQASSGLRGLREVARKDLQLLVRGIADKDAHRVLNPHDHPRLALMLPTVHLHMVPRLRAANPVSHAPAPGCIPKFQLD